MKILYAVAGLLVGAAVQSAAQLLTEPYKPAPPYEGKLRGTIPINPPGVVGSWSQPIMLTARYPDGSPGHITLDSDGMVIANCGPR